MKRFLYSAAAIAAAFSLASCSSDEPANGATGNDAVTFNIEVPGNLATRATFGDESAASLNNLQWTVYDMTDTQNPAVIFSSQKSGAFQASQKYESVSLQLIKGKKYQVAFFADNANDKFVTFTDGKLNVDYSQAASNTANEDAFTGVSDVFTLTDQGYSATVTLTRPFAQLNWGTDDINAEMVQALINTLEAQVRVTSGLYDTFDVLSGTFSGEVTDPVELPAVKLNNLPAETFPVVSQFKTYRLIAMNYLLTGDGTIDCELKLNGIDDSVKVSQADVKVNYRTNIYGSLLTAPGQFNIVVDNNFNEPDFNYPVTNADEFLAAVNAGTDFEIPANTLVNISDLGEVSLANGQTMTVNGILQTTRQQISISGAGNSATVNGSGTIEAIGAMGNRPLNVYDGATLTVTGVNVNSNQNNGGSTIYSLNGNLILENMTSLKNSNFAIGANGGTLSMKNCDIASDSSNKAGAWSYTVSVAEGCQAVFDNVNVTGIQGGVTVDGTGSLLTIKSGTYTTHQLDGFTGGTAFYPVYVCNDGALIIEGGEFISGCGYTIYDGDNDINKPFADYITIKGGKFNKPTYSQKTHTEIPAADGYQWKTINEDPFTLTVVKK